MGGEVRGEEGGVGHVETRKAEREEKRKG